MTDAALSADERCRLWMLEPVLDRTEFAGTSVGAFANDLLIGVQLGRPISPAKDVLRLARELASWRTQRSETVDVTGRIVVTWIDAAPRIADMVVPVLQALEDQAVALVAHEPLLTALPPGTPGLWDGSVGGDRPVGWLRDAAPAVLGWARGTWRRVADGSFPRRAVPGLAHLMVLQTRRYRRYLERFAAQRPSAVLVEYDRGTFAAPIVLAARRLGIPTATMVHGGIGSYGYTPVVADQVLCWGPEQARRLIEQGVDRSRVVETGCPRVGLHQGDRRSIRSKAGLDADRPVVLLATNRRLSLRERNETAAAFMDATGRLGGDVQVAIRPHPRESLDDYAAGLAGRPIHVFDANRLTTDEVLTVVDLVVACQSAFVDEAIIAEVPVIVYESGVRPEDLLVGLGASNPVAPDPAALDTCLQRWWHDSTWREELQRLVGERRADLCVAIGTDSADRIAAVARRMAGGLGLAS